MIEVIFQSLTCGIIAYGTFADLSKAFLVFIVMFNILFALEKINESIKK